MAKAINDDICIQGSTLVIGVKFKPIDGTYTFTQLLNAGNITVKYYIINTETKYTVSSLYNVLPSDDADYNNMRAFTIANTSALTPGVLMVECIANIPAHGNLPARTEISRCSTGIAIIK